MSILASQRVISEEIEKLHAGAQAGETQPRLDFALFTRIYLPAGPAVLDGDPLLASLDAAERRAMVAVREADGSLRFDVHLQGPRETPFLSFPGHPR